MHVNFRNMKKTGSNLYNFFFFFFFNLYNFNYTLKKLLTIYITKSPLTMKLVNSPFLGEKIRMVRQSKTRVANETVVDDIFRLFETRKSKITYNSLKRHFLKSCRPWQAGKRSVRKIFKSLWPKVSFEFSSLYPFLKSRLVFLKKVSIFCLSRL